MAPDKYLLLSKQPKLKKNGVICLISLSLDTPEKSKHRFHWNYRALRLQARGSEKTQKVSKVLKSEAILEELQ